MDTTPSVNYVLDTEGRAILICKFLVGSSYTRVSRTLRVYLEM